MRRIELANLDPHLAADAGNNMEGYTGWEADYDGDAVADQCWHIAHNVERQRGGIVMVGVGSSKNTFWVDAKTPEEVLASHHANEVVTALTK